MILDVPRIAAGVVIAALLAAVPGAGAQDRHHVVDRLQRPQVRGSSVDHHVGATSEQHRRIGGRDDADRVDAAQLAGISSCLHVAVHDQVHQLQFGVIDHAPQRDHAH